MKWILVLAFIGYLGFLYYLMLVGVRRDTTWSDLWKLLKRGKS